VTRRRRSRRTNLTLVTALLALGGVSLLWGRTSQVRALPKEIASDTSVEASPSRQAPRHAEKRASTTPERSASASVGQSIHVALGVPTDSDPSDDYILDHGVYVLSYNHKKNVANWVAWELDRAFLGHVRRKNDFRPDALLPADFYHVTAQDYRKSGFDRGHLCPSADREATLEDNSLTFLMTNIQPQLHELNEGPWEKLEEHERELARRRDSEVFIVAGGIFDADYQRIGHEVAVPRANFKIIVTLRQGQGASDVKFESKLVAVIIPNAPGVGSHPWTDYLTSVDAIEKATGYDFLSNVPKAVQDVIEAKVASME